MKFSFSLPLLLLLVAGSYAYAQTTLVLQGSEEKVIAGRHTSYWEDKSSNATLSHVLSDSVQNQFVKSQQDILAFGLSSSAYWLKLPITFNADATNQSWLLEFTLASYAEISFFELQNGQWQEVKTGAAFPFKQRPVDYRFFTFPLSKTSSSEAVYYVRIKTLRAYTIPIVIYRSDAFISKTIRQEWLYGAFIGILVFIAGYNLLLFFSLRERSYLYCSAYVMLSAIILGIYNGYLFQFLFPNVTVTPALLQTYTTLAQRAFIVIFTISFLGLRWENRGRSYNLLVGLLVLIALTIALVPMLSLQTITHWQLLLSLITLGLTSITGICFWRKGKRQARFITIGYVLYTLGVLYNNLLFYRLVNPNFFSIHGPEIGIFFESICLTLALGDKYRIERQTKTEELQATVANLAKQNEDLEQFSFVVSHNLRAPVARILGLINLFQLEPKEKVGEHLKLSANALDDVIRDLTEIVSIRKDVNRRREKIKIPELIDGELKLLAETIKEAGGTYTLQYELVEANGLAVYLKSIVHNLISNAIKYRDPDRPLQIQISTWREGNQSVIAVRDNGLGIKDPGNSKIFGLYQRFHDHVEGKGLGLYLVKTQVEAMNGRVTVESQIGKGSTFTVYLPNEG